jgi:hypothetical protein
MSTQRAGFAVVRVDRRGELPPAYLRGFALAGRKGLRQYMFGPQASAHVFERQAEAEDVARRLRRRISATEHDYVVVEVASEASVPS